MSDWKPKKGEMVIPTDLEKYEDSLRKEGFFREFIATNEAGTIYYCWDSKKRHLVGWKRVFPVEPKLTIVPGEIYMVRDSSNEEWVPRKAPSEDRFYAIVGGVNQMEVDTSWKYVREATEDEKKGYLNPWRCVFPPGKWPDCRPSDKIEVWNKDSYDSRTYCREASWFDWDRRNGIPLYWRYEK